MEKTCTQCKQVLETVVPNDTTEYQYDNALWIGFYGGYGMFVESPEYAHYPPQKTVLPHATHEAVLCHDCAYELCEMLPWLKEMIDPENSHTHKE